MFLGKYEKNFIKGARVYSKYAWSLGRILLGTFDADGEPKLPFGRMLWTVPMSEA